MLKPYQIGFVTVGVGGLWFAIRNSSRARRINILLSVLGLVLVYAIAIMNSTVKRSQFIEAKRRAPPTVVKLLAHEISHCTFSFDLSSDPNDLMYETAVDVVLPEQSAWTVNHHIQDHVKNGLESSAPQSRFFTRR